MNETDQKLKELIDAKFATLQRRDYFGVLGIETTAESSAVQKAYFTLAKLVHPDKIARSALDAVDKERANQVFKFISDAYTTLMDPTKRQAVIRSAEAGQPNPFAGAGGAASKGHREEGRIYHHKGQRLLQMRGYADAEKVLRQALKLAPGEAGILVDLGWAVFNNPEHPEAARMEEAHSLWSKARIKDKDDPRSHYYTALYYKATGDTLKARSALEAAVAVKPNYIEAQRELRLLEMREGKAPASAKSASGKSFLEKNLPSLAKLLRKKR